MSFEMARSRPVRLLDNPLAIRALAHPVRLSLYGLVGRDGPVTSSQAGRELGISQALASHHMRQLAKYGFVEPAEAVNERDRPWQVTADSTTWRGADGDPDRADAADVLEQVLAEQSLASLAEWQQRRRGAGPGWRDITGVTRNLLYISQAELAELTDAIDALVQPFAQRAGRDASSRPAGAVPADLTLLVSVLRPTSSGN